MNAAGAVPPAPAGEFSCLACSALVSLGPRSIPADMAAGSIIAISVRSGGLPEAPPLRRTRADLLTGRLLVRLFGRQRVWRPNKVARHARPCAGHPRLSCQKEDKTWMAGTKPGHDEKLRLRTYALQLLRIHFFVPADRPDRLFRAGPARS